MATLTDSQMAGYLQAAGFPSNEIGRGVAIGLAESGGRTDASHTNTNGTVDRGVWQINSIHNVQGDLFDPTVNAAAAFSIWKAAGNSWRPWSTYPAAYLPFLARGNKAAGAPNVTLTGGPTTSSTAPVADTSTLSKLTSGGLWLRLGAFLLGTILLIVGVQQMMGINKTIVHVIRGAVKTAAVA